MKVYEYGACAPRVNAEAVAAQMHLAHRYYNTLVELEHQQREEYDALMCEFDEYAALSELAGALEADVEERRAAAEVARAVSGGGSGLRSGRRYRVLIMAWDQSAEVDP